MSFLSCPEYVSIRRNDRACPPKPLKTKPVVPLDMTEDVIALAGAVVAFGLVWQSVPDQPHPTHLLGPRDLNTYVYLMGKAAEYDYLRITVVFQPSPRCLF